MFMRLSAVLCLVLQLSPAFSEPFAAPRPFSRALEATTRGNWEEADLIAAKAGPEARAVIEWVRLRAGLGDAREVLAFAQARPDWPGLARMFARVEDRTDELPDAQRLAFFRRYAPQTGDGVLAHAEALLRAGQRGDAEASLVLAWRSFDLTSAQHAAFLERHGDLLAPHHDARLDMALWRGLSGDVQLMLPLVSEGQRLLAKARQGLRAGESDPEALIGLVPEPLQDHPGLAYEVFLWNYHRGSKERAIELMTERSAKGALGEPRRWAGWRRSLARQLMREGDPVTAYALTLEHGLNDGSAFADLEWLAGYLSLRKLDEPERALNHFKSFEQAVQTPISLGRAGFWKGEALAALGRAQEAQAAYTKGAEHQTSFYGLLAAEKAGIEPDPSLGGQEYFPAWQQADFVQDEMAKIVILAVKNNRLTLAEQFLLALARGADPRRIGQLGNMAEDIGAPHLQVMLGKAATGQGIVLPAHYYALHPMIEMDLPVPMELALAIARRESEFDPRVRSGAGAEGLMQLMPGTAAETAREIGREHVQADVMNDWRYNAALGSAYLEKLARRFDGNIVMIGAGYNAGPSRPDRWMAERGDPRAGDMDMIDWIEHIPFNETRNYVMRVAESLPVYRARLGRDPHPVPFSQELSGALIE